MRQILASFSLSFAVIATLAVSMPIAAAAELWDDLPPGEGRRETYVHCTACHSILLVSQQGLTRERWAETLDWMEQEQGMPPLDSALRKMIINYLAEVFSPERPYYKPTQ